MYREVLEAEVNHGMQVMHPTKEPEPDGFSAQFYQQY